MMSSGEEKVDAPGGNIAPMCGTGSPPARVAAGHPGGDVHSPLPSPSPSSFTHSISHRLAAAASGVGGVGGGVGGDGGPPDPLDTEWHKMLERRGAGAWMPDGASGMCIICNGNFNFLRRRHHCRRCGGVMCASCSAQKMTWEVVVRSMGSKFKPSPSTADLDAGSQQRVCNACCKVVDHQVGGGACPVRCAVCGAVCGAVCALCGGVRCAVCW